MEEIATAPSEKDAAFPETADIETSSDDYAARFAGPAGEWMLRTQERLVLDGLRAVGAQTVLDVGGGHGQLAGPMARAGHQVTVLGSAAVCARRIREEVAAEQIRFLVGNVLALPFEDQSFDAVVSVRLLPHCERWPELVRELCRVARFAVVVDYPTRRSLNALAPLFFGAKKKLEGNTRAWRMFTDAELRHAFTAAGFRLAGRHGQFFWPMVLHRALKEPRLSRWAEAPCRWLGLTRLWGSPILAVWRRR